MLAFQSLLPLFLYLLSPPCLPIFPPLLEKAPGVWPLKSVWWDLSILSECWLRWSPRLPTLESSFAWNSLKCLIFSWQQLNHLLSSWKTQWIISAGRVSCYPGIQILSLSWLIHFCLSRRPYLLRSPEELRQRTVCSLCGMLYYTFQSFEDKRPSIHSAGV